MNYITLGQRIRNVRKAMRLTQGQVAASVEISESFYGHIERGNRKPSLETVAKLSLSLGVSIDQLVFGNNTPASYSEKIAFYKTLK